MGKDLKGKELGNGLSQRKNGKYSARYKTKGGKRVEKYFDKLTDAKAWLLDFVYEDEHSGIINTSNMTVNDLFNCWYDNMKKRVKYNTCRIYHNTYDYRIKPIIGDVFISDIKPMHCQMVLNKAMDSDYATETLSKVRSVMRMFFEYALDNELIKTNPVTKNVSYYKKEKKEKRIFTLSEQKMFIEIGKFSNHYDEFIFILNTGLRCGELSALRWSDIDFDKRMINIKNTMYYNEDTDKFEINSTKTKSGTRSIPLTPIAYDILIKKKRERQIVQLEYKDFVFLTNGKPTRSAVYNRSLTAITKRMKVENISMHGLRHTFATRCIESGMKPKILQRILGHANIAMTMDLYVHVTEDETVSEMNKLYIVCNAYATDTPQNYKIM